MGRAGLDRLAARDGYECAVVTDDGRAFTTPGARHIGGGAGGQR
ncbi:MAG TPA: hypothetical protein VFB84_05195 [Micromonosporaceae bacterium]|nr:hypothetical protein [Micromonosporaceae bacterium]